MLLLRRKVNERKAGDETILCRRSSLYSISISGG
jgi:hypothetical protein